MKYFALKQIKGIQNVYKNDTCQNVIYKKMKDADGYNW